MNSVVNIGVLGPAEGATVLLLSLLVSVAEAGIILRLLIISNKTVADTSRSDAHLYEKLIAFLKCDITSNLSTSTPVEKMRMRNVYLGLVFTGVIGIIATIKSTFVVTN